MCINVSNKFAKRLTSTDSSLPQTINMLQNYENNVADLTKVFCNAV